MRVDGYVSPFSIKIKEDEDYVETMNKSRNLNFRRRRSVPILKRIGVHIHVNNNVILFQHDSDTQRMIVEVLDSLANTFRQKFISFRTGQEWSPYVTDLNHIDF